MSVFLHLSILMLIGGFILMASGSEIRFSNSGTIMPLRTENLTLVCELNETVPPTSSGAIVGRRRRDVTQTLENVHPVAMVISKGTEKIASISQFIPAKALVNNSNIHVTGKFDGSPRYNGYLAVRWQYPTKAQVGDYECKVTTISDQGSGIQFSRNTTVDISGPSIDDIVDYIHSLKVEARQQQAVDNELRTQIHDQDAKIQALESQNHNQSSQIQTLKSQNHNQSSQIQTLKSQNHNQSSQISTLKTQIIDLTSKLQTSQTDIQKLKHTETGYIDCGRSDGSPWSYGYSSADTLDGGLVRKMTQRFKESYSQPPVVFLSIIEPNFYQDTSRYTAIHYGVSLESVNKDTFVVKCFAENGFGYIYRLRAAWISFSHL